jgi:di/tricarboxylate transporter
MEISQIIVLAVIVAAMVFFFKEWLPVEVTAMAAIAVLLLADAMTPLEIISARDFLRGFSNSAPVTIASLFVLSAALERTGVIDAIGRFLVAQSRGSLMRAMALILLVPLPLSAFMNNTPIVVILMPAVLAMARAGGLPPSKLLIPLSFATILGGTCTMIGTSTNLIVDGIVREAGLAPFGLFSITPLGVIYAIIGCAYLLVLGPRLLPNRETLSSLLTPDMRREFLVQASVPAESPLVGQVLGELLKGPLRGMRVLEVRRRGLNLQDELTGIVVEAGDRLLVRTGTKGVHHLKSTDGVQVGFPGLGGALEAMEEREAMVMEGIVGPNSSLVGRTLKNLHFRQRFGVLILAIHREGRNVTSRLESLPLEFGDTLLVEGPREGIARLLEQRDFINLSEVTEKPYRREKAPLAIAAMAGFMLAATFSGLDTSVIAFLCALGVVLVGCVTTSEAYDSVEWKILLLIISMLAVGRAMENTGTAEWIANHVTGWFAPLGPLVLLSAIYLLTSILTEIVSNNAVAALLPPIVLKMADNMEISPLPFVVAVMFGASASFATPIGYQTNTYVYGAGGYRFADFMRIGVPLNLVLWLAATLLIPLFWPF